ncbi:MAG TPA: hypothetical protein VFG50_11795, partial [Rhodothermales bacterium]|nr:hypothetical protein [Rhodothermales bacterium]
AGVAVIRRECLEEMAGEGVGVVAQHGGRTTETGGGSGDVPKLRHTPESVAIPYHEQQKL